MEPTIPTSFIPKRPIVTADIPKEQHRATGILSFITIVMVIATAASYAWVYIDEKQLNARSSELAIQITQAREELGVSFVQEIKRFSDRIDGAKILIGRHVVISPIFSSLEQSTLKTVEYKSFTYGLTEDPVTKLPSVQVEVVGTAQSYQSLALQSDAFIDQNIKTVIKNPVFSALTVEDKTNRIGFKLVFMVDAADLSYETFVRDTAVGQAAITSPSL